VRIVNREQADHWNGEEASHWVIHQAAYDRMLAPGRRPPGALTTGGPAAMTRIRRLLARPRSGRAAARLAAAAALALPVAIACTPLAIVACDLAGRA